MSLRRDFAENLIAAEEKKPTRRVVKVSLVAIHPIHIFNRGVRRHLTR
jgi:hypothetical protein